MQRIMYRTKGISDGVPCRITGVSLTPSFIDIFAGCGGLSLGLFRAGWQGLFGVERDAFAFDTLNTNFHSGDRPYYYSWPTWLPEKPIDLACLLSAFHGKLLGIASQVDLLVGGPPCQGFSSAGRRDPRDPRNELLLTYLNAVRVLQPKLVMIENVRGITIDFSQDDGCSGNVNYAKELQLALADRYFVWSKILDASDFGVPQKRARFFIVAQRKDLLPVRDPFHAIEERRQTFLRRQGLWPQLASSAAISDLEVTKNGRVPSRDTPGFEEIGYAGPSTHYQELMRDGAIEAPSDTRLARHGQEIVRRFGNIIAHCHADGHLNTSLKKADRDRYGLRKQAIRVLDPDRPAPTITSMPDDLLHYSEPRTLTVRENARLQSFPDWFTFKGKYTTGGHLRRREVPRFTQVANAVPPLMAEAIGEVLLKLVRTLR